MQGVAEWVLESVNLKFVLYVLTPVSPSPFWGYILVPPRSPWVPLEQISPFSYRKASGTNSTIKQADR